MLLSYYPKQFRFDESYFKKTVCSSFWRLAIFSNSINISIEITNPILLGKYIDVKSAIHIGFLDFHLFPDSPEFHATFKILNIKNFHEYTNKFVLHVVDLECIHLATEEDKAYETDKWASFFKAKTWEELIMLADQMPSLQSSVETLYQLNTDEQIRETCDRFIRAENRERGYKNYIAKLTEENLKLSEEKSNQAEKITNQAEKITQLESLLAEHGIQIPNH